MMPLDELFKLLWELLEGAARWMNLAEWGANAALDLFLHFVWSSCAGLLVFYSTYWIIRTLFFLGARLLRLPTSPPELVARGMVGLGWAAALFASLSAHLWWDRLLSFGGGS
jgi:hypothetical protein